MDAGIQPGKKTCDLRDWLVMTLVTLAWVVATVFLFRHPSDLNFASWGTFSATIIGAYHWITYRDDKTPDTP